MLDEIVVDSFAGGGGTSEGIVAAIGRDPDIAINHDRFALAMHRVNHPNTEHLVEDVVTLDAISMCAGRPVGMLWMSPDCFPAGTLVLTDLGYRAIETIEVGDTVLSHRLRWRKVTQTHRSERPLLKVKGRGHPGLLVSPEHPFLIRERTDVWKNSVRGYRGQYGIPQWRPACAIGAGALYWALAAEVPQLPIPPLQRANNKATILPVDERLMWLAGRYLGDGWSRIDATRAELVIICGKHEAEALLPALDMWPRSGARVAAGELNWSSRETRTSVQFAAQSRALVAWLRDNFGHGAEHKTMPAWAFGMERSLREALLAGYVSADGCKSPDWKGNELVRTSTVSRALAFSVRQLADSLGYAATVHANTIVNDVIEGRKVNAKASFSVHWRPSPDPKHARTFVEDGIRWSPIASVEPQAETSPVFNIAVEDDESYVVEGVIVHNCKDHSKAKGGKPRDKNIRGLAWAVLGWVKALPKWQRPRVVFLENVEEFREWGPLLKSGKRCPVQKGVIFQQFISSWRALGYTNIEWRERRAWKAGAGTIRKRLYVIMRRDGEPIVWPEPTHGDPNDPVQAEWINQGKLKPWVTAADSIDFSLPCPSIFDTAAEIKAKYGVRAIRPLQPSTMARLAKGTSRYVVNNAKPFIVPVTHKGDLRSNPIDEPLRTITSAHRGEHAVAVPVMVGCGGRAAQTEPRPGDAPVITQTAKADLCVAAVHLSTMRNAQKPFNDADKPIHTLTAGGANIAVSAAYLAKHYGDEGQRPGSLLGEPVGTITGIDHNSLVAAHMLTLRGSDRRGAPADVPLNTLSAQGQHAAAVYTHLTKYYGAGQPSQPVDKPLHTETAKPRFGVVDATGEFPPLSDAQISRARQVADFLRSYGYWDDREFVTVGDRIIVDIGMRMLTPRERFNAQGFRRNYIIDHGILEDGSIIKFTAEQQGYMVGNSVCPPEAAALIGANYRPRQVQRPRRRRVVEFPLLEAAE